MNKEKPKLPGFFASMWLLFMQPITLRHRLKACGIEEPNATLQQLWFAKDEMRTLKRQYVKQKLALLFIFTPIASLLISWLIIELLILQGYSIDFEKWAVNLTFDVIASMIFGVVASMLGSVAVGVAGGLAEGVASGVAEGIVFSVTEGISEAVIFGVAEGIAIGMAFGAAIIGIVGIVAIGAAIGAVFSIGIGLAYGTLFGVVFGVAFGVAFIFGIYRFFLYPVEIVGQSVCYLLQRYFNYATLRFVPVLHHNLSYLPHPFLARHIILAAKTEPELAKQVIEACAIAPGQRRAGQVALAHLQAQ